MKNNYDKTPSIKIDGNITIGWDNIIKNISDTIVLPTTVLVFDCYVGVHHDEIVKAISKLKPEVLIHTANLFKPENEILKMTDVFMTDDTLFGYMSNIQMSDYFDKSKLEDARATIENTKGLAIVYGYGAAMVPAKSNITIYADMARWEIQQRFRKQSVVALGVDNSKQSVSLQYKRGLFNDWRVCDAHKTDLYNKVDFWVDTNKENEPKMISRNQFFAGIEKGAKAPFRVVPFFDPAPWGGQWMKDVCNLDKAKPNYGWCFDCVPEENSLLLEADGVMFEMPSVNLVNLKTRELLGAPVEARFGKNFPIRFDFLDTVGGGNLSLQVHPTNEFAYKNFGLNYTQDESYYLLDAKEGATVYLGLKNGVDKEAMTHDLRESQKGNLVFDAEKYTNVIPAKKHDHFLIPSGTIHCSGSAALVLEISSTPNLFTFKLWDWQRLGLDGKPRPINVERGLKVIDWSRDTDYVMKELVNPTQIIAEGEGWKEEKTGLHKTEFIETRRHWFTTKVQHTTNESVNVLNLIEGDEVVVESPTNSFEPFKVNYAETFIIPAAVGEYTIRPCGTSEGKQCATIKAYVRY